MRLEGERVDELEMVCVRWTGIDDDVKGMEDLRMGSRFLVAGGCREGALPDGRAREEEEELCEKHGWLIWSRARECTGRGGFTYVFRDAQTGRLD